MACSVDYHVTHCSHKGEPGYSIENIMTTDQNSCFFIKKERFTLSISFQPAKIRLISIGIRTPVTVRVCCSGKGEEYQCSVWPKGQEKLCKLQIPDAVGPVSQVRLEFTAFHGYTEVKICSLIVIASADQRPLVRYRPNLTCIPPSVFYPSKPPVLLQKRLSDWYPTLKPKRKLA